MSRFTLALISGAVPVASSPSDMLNEGEFDPEDFTSHFPLTHILEVMIDWLLAFAAWE